MDVKVPPPEGWTRLLVEHRSGAGRHYVALDPETEEQRYAVDGHVATRPKAEIRDRDNRAVYSVRGPLLGSHKRIAVIDSDGLEVAWLDKEGFSPITSRMTVPVVEQQPWVVEGRLADKEYVIVAGGAPIVRTAQEPAVEGGYVLDVVEGVDPGLALAVTWAIERWVAHH